MSNQGKHIPLREVIRRGRTYLGVHKFVHGLFWCCVLILIFGLSCRLLWYASETQTGITMIRIDWTDATWGWIAGEHQRVAWREPASQASYWLDEIEHLSADDAEDAEAVMGAALVLDGPDGDYSARHVTNITTAPGGGLIPDIDRDVLREAEDVYEALCSAKCIALAAKATTLQPDNVELWRLRALLLRRYSLHSSDRAPRGDQFREVLQQAMQHDPDNALYDYIAAKLCWDAGAELEYRDQNLHLVIKDEEQFERGIAHFDRAMGKPLFATSDRASLLIDKFARQTTIPAAEIPSTASSHTIYVRFSLLLRDVWRYHEARGLQAESEGKLNQALAIYRECVQLTDQYRNSSPFMRNSKNAHLFHRIAVHRLHLFVNEQKQLVPAAELEVIRRLEETARLDELVVKSAEVDAAGQQSVRPSPGVSSFDSPAWLMACALISGLSPPIIVLLLATAALTFFLAGWGDAAGLPQPSIAGNLTALAVSVAITFTIFGLAPARIIPAPAQAWLLTMLVIASPVVGLIGSGYLWLRRRAFKFSFRAMLSLVVAFSILSAILAATRPHLKSFTQFPFDLVIPAIGWDGLNAGMAELLYRPSAEWWWAVMQFSAYHGDYLTLPLWALLSATLLRIKFRRRKLHASWKNLLCVWSRPFGTSCLALSALLSVLYLLTTPVVIAKGEQKFQHQIAPVRNPSRLWTEIGKAARQIRADKERLQHIRLDVRQQMEEALRDEADFSRHPE